jgi:NADH dehydrogenase (ubiquinone) 1 beta subcomplex subunit 9
VISWAENRDVFNEQALKIRTEFDANKNIPAESPKVPRLIRLANDRLAAQTHPDPYIYPYMPGGSLFMRNPAIPIEALYPDGIPEGVST